MNDAWERIMADPRLARARSKLSIHELRLIISHAKAETDSDPQSFCTATGLFCFKRGCAERGCEMLTVSDGGQNA